MTIYKTSKYTGNKRNNSNKDLNIQISYTIISSLFFNIQNIINKPAVLQNDNSLTYTLNN